jgi:hypothetical protein
MFKEPLMFKVAILMLTSSFIAGPDKPYVVLERGDVRAVIVNNEPVDDQVLPGHHGGYSGVASLTHKAQDKNLFVPFYAGLNFEHIHDGTNQPRDNVRLSQSPSGGGNGNPAWDFQWFVPQYQVGRKYRFVMRAMYLPFESTQQIIRATARHRAALEQ